MIDTAITAYLFELVTTDNKRYEYSLFLENKIHKIKSSKVSYGRELFDKVASGGVLTLV
jgi:hypothetical protein